MDKKDFIFSSLQQFHDSSLWWNSSKYFLLTLNASRFDFFYLASWKSRNRGRGCSSRAFQSIAFQNWQNPRDNHGLGNHKNHTKLKLTLLVSLFSHILTSWCLKSEQDFFKYSFSDTEQFLDRQVLWKLFERFRNWTQDLLIADFRSIIQLTTWFETFHLPASYWLVNYFLIQQSID